ncbi:MAG TPA: hypothetical protein VHU88_15675 [Sporichthyaceae bacterium]|jgi:hypothetical protein|nr:hypothetical protein [Sporichthyaceae bacterium]
MLADMAGERIFCAHCGVEIRRRLLGGWGHVVRLGPMPCPVAEREPPPEDRTSTSREN